MPSRSLSRLKIWALLPALLIAAPARADRDPCPPPESFVEDIYNCGMNEVAVAHATRCSDALIAEGKAQGLVLQAALDALRAQLGSSQTVSMSDTAKRLQIAVNQLTRQINKIEKKTRLVASYTGAMIDVDGATDDASSLACFNENFHELQKVADGMVDEFRKSKAARDAALQMIATVNQRSENLEANLDSFNGRLPSPTASERAAAAKANRLPAAAYDGSPKQGKSDISGTKEYEAQQKKTK